MISIRRLAKKISGKIKAVGVRSEVNVASLSFSFLKRKIKRFFEYVEYSKHIHNQKGILSAIKFIFMGDNKKERFRRSMISALMTYVAPVMSAVLLFNVVLSAAATDYCVAVSFNGDTVAYVESESIYNEAEALLKSKIASDSAVGQAIVLEPELQVTKNFGYKLMATEELANELVTYTSAELTMAYGIYAGNEFITAVYDKTQVESFVKDYLAKEIAKYPDSNTMLSNEFFYIEGLYLKKSIVTDETAKTLLFENHSISVDYTVSDGDTVDTVSAKFGIDNKSFMQINPKLTDKSLVPGAALKINIYEPFLSTVCVRKETVTEAIEFETETVMDSSRYVTDPVKVKVKGEKGSKDYIYEISERNGVELSRTLTDEVITKEPVNKQVSVGSLIKIKVPVTNGQLSDGADADSKTGGSLYLWPVGNGGGYVSSGFGGERKHTGVDIAATLGTPIYAATDGIVTRVVNGTTGYGKYIVIKNDDGLLTYYAHCNFLAVKVGDQVKMGQFIGEVGSTGNSTGAHLHFEVRSGSTKLNPMSFLK